MNKPLWAHQKETIALGKVQSRIFDMSDPGTGKTRAHIELFAARRKRKGGKALVTCPKTLMRSAWLADIQEFEPGLTVAVASAKDRDEMLAHAQRPDIDVLITNTDAIKVLSKLPSTYWRGFDTWINDEHSAYKHRTSQRSKAAALIRRQFEYRAGLTGTPNPVSVTELWHQALLLDDGKRLGTNYWKFQSGCCVPKPIPGTIHVKWEDREGIERVVAELLRDITVRHEFDQCMDIPANTVRTIQFQLPNKVMAQYKKFENDAVLELETGDITAVHAAALRTKLLQVASGAVYDREHLVHLIDNSRNELVGDLVEEIDHSIVFFNWTHQRDGLAKELEGRGISYAVLDGDASDKQREAAVKGFQAGDLRCLLLHPRTGAHGLTLTRGRRAIVASPFYEADLFKQAIHRIYRGGQTRKTETILVSAPGTIEALVYRKQQDKAARMMDLLAMIKESKQ